MPDSPHAPPKSRVRDKEPARPRPVLGVVVGAVVDIGGTLIAGVVLAIGYATLLAARGVQAENIAKILQYPHPTTGFFQLSISVGMLFSVLGGYVCAALAVQNVYRPAYALAAIIAGSGFLMSFGNYSNELNAVLTLIAFGAVMAGAWLYERTHPGAASPSERG